MQRALDGLMPYTAELFAHDAVIRDCVARGIGADPGVLKPEWDARIESIVRQATLQLPASTWTPGGGREGIHTECFGYMLAEMQYLHRSHPGASW
jgi:ring-1,2-phenylacetyl-CoA epoxidase subunit PaaC